MNKFQKQYLKTIKQHKSGHVLDLSIASLYMASAGYSLYSAPYTSKPWVLAACGAAAVGLGLWNLISGVKSIKKKKIHAKDVKEVNAEKWVYPLQHVRDISITDKKGLEGILERTRANESKEWATCSKAKTLDDAADIYSILDSKQAENEGLIIKRKKHSVTTKILLADERGFNGHWHFHPSVGGHNYAINPTDIICGFNEYLNFITFNMPDGPEIIGYNRQYVYIPKDKTKTELARASQEQIFEYLSRYQ
ncbi:MAG: hypothetical protein PHO02_03950 [Candidatus Nanoarchaeia archaeon]|nr:hypothetical protein [Candidatus Nanoarchaeia archaeon]